MGKSITQSERARPLAGYVLSEDSLAGDSLSEIVQ